MGMASRPCVELRLELEIDAEPIAGRLRLEGGAPRSFSGWLGLAAALEDALDAGRQAPAGTRSPPD